MISLDTIAFLAQRQPTEFAAIAGLFGLIIGSFLNVVIYRIPKMLETSFRYECACLDDPESEVPPRFDLIKPDSTCPKCGTAIKPWHNIPVISWLLLKGKCHACSAPISVRYPAIELATGILTAWAEFHFGWNMQALGAALLIWTLIALFWIDADTYFLPDNITLPLLWLGLIFNLGNTFTDISSAVIGAAAGYLCLWTIYWAHRLITGREGMGFGDFKLLAAIGAWLGWQILPAVILISSIVGAIIGITMTIMAKRGWGTPLPFGPYLAIAAFVALMYRAPLLHLIWG